MARQNLLKIFVLVISMNCVLSEFNLTIVHIADLHSHWFEFDENKLACSDEEAKGGKCFGGFPRLLTFVRDIRKKEENVLVLSSGEFFFGRSLHAMHGWKVAQDVLPKLELDAMSLANHDFDNGMLLLSGFLYGQKFPVLCANLKARETSYMYSRVNKSVVLDIDGEKIGIVGYIHRDALLKSFNAAVSVKFSDEIPALQEEVRRLEEEEGVNKIIALGHAGYYTDLEIAKKVKGVDIVMGGDSDIMLFNPGDDESLKEGNIHGNYPRVHHHYENDDDDNKNLVNRTLVLHIPQHGLYVGVLRATFNDEGKIIHESGEPVLLDSSIPQDEDVLQFLYSAQEALEEIMHNSRLPHNQEVLAQAHGFLDGEPKSCRTRECSLGSFVADAMFLEFRGSYLNQTNNRDYFERWGPVDALVINAGTFVHSLEPGPLNMDVIFHSVMLGEFMKRVPMYGEQVKQMMEHSVQNYDPLGIHAPGAFLQVAGLKVEYDLSQEPGNRVRTLLIRCRDCDSEEYSPIKPYKTYIIVMPNFIRSGGDGFYAFEDTDQYDLGQFDALLLVEHLQRVRDVYPKLDGRIRFYQKNDSQEKRTRFWPGNVRYGLANTTDVPEKSFLTSNPSMNDGSQLSSDNGNETGNKTEMGFGENSISKSVSTDSSADRASEVQSIGISPADTLSATESVYTVVTTPYSIVSDGKQIKQESHDNDASLENVVEYEGTVTNVLGVFEVSIATEINKVLNHSTLDKATASENKEENLPKSKTDVISRSENTTINAFLPDDKMNEIDSGPVVKTISHKQQNSPEENYLPHSKGNVLYVGESVKSSTGKSSKEFSEKFMKKDVSGTHPTKLSNEDLDREKPEKNDVDIGTAIYTFFTAVYNISETNSSVINKTSKLMPSIAKDSVNEFVHRLNKRSVSTNPPGMNKISAETSFSIRNLGGYSYFIQELINEAFQLISPNKDPSLEKSPTHKLSILKAEGNTAKLEKINDEAELKGHQTEMRLDSAILTEINKMSGKKNFPFKNLESYADFISGIISEVFGVLFLSQDASLAKSWNQESTDEETLPIGAENAEDSEGLYSGTKVIKHDAKMQGPDVSEISDTKNSLRNNPTAESKYVINKGSRSLSVSKLISVALISKLYPEALSESDRPYVEALKTAAEYIESQPEIKAFTSEMKDILLEELAKINIEDFGNKAVSED